MFFDDEPGNIQELSKLGVTTILLGDGKGYLRRTEAVKQVVKIRG